MKWLTVPEAAQYVRRSKSTVHKAAAAAVLHSHQSCPNGKRTFTEAALNAWAQGLPEAAQRRACGCEQILRAVS
jgi:excisionase family DNA binding protein